MEMSVKLYHDGSKKQGVEHSRCFSGKHALGAPLSRGVNGRRKPPSHPSTQLREVLRGWGLLSIFDNRKEPVW